MPNSFHRFHRYLITIGYPSQTGQSELIIVFIAFRMSSGGLEKGFLEVASYSYFSPNFGMDK